MVPNAQVSDYRYRSAQPGRRPSTLPFPATRRSEICTRKPTLRKKSPTIYLHPDDVVFTLKTRSDQPIVELDKSTGGITALHPGHAIIQTSFAGATVDTCVVVMPDLVHPDASNCEELHDPIPSAKVGPVPYNRVAL